MPAFKAPEKAILQDTLYHNWAVQLRQVCGVDKCEPTFDGGVPRWQTVYT